jgi:hypothetical protein
MAFLGLDLTDPYAARPRPVDVAVVDRAGRCVLERLPGGAALDVGAWLAPVTTGPGSGDLLVIDGPLALGSPGATMRTCERLLAAPGKTPGELPRPGSRPFAGFVRGSVELADRLVAAGWVPLRDAEERASATMLEAYPGATWRRLAGAPMPGKTTRAGVAARTDLLQRLGLTFPRAPSTHDELDAALCAWLGWQLRCGVLPLELVGLPCREEDGRLREGMILEVADARVRAA